MHRPRRSTSEAKRCDSAADPRHYFHPAGQTIREVDPYLTDYGFRSLTPARRRAKMRSIQESRWPTGPWAWHGDSCVAQAEVRNGPLSAIYEQLRNRRRNQLRGRMGGE